MKTSIQSLSKSSLFAFGLASSMCCLGCFSAKQEVNLKLTDCPAAVQKTIRDNSSGARAAEVIQETKADGIVIYKVLELKPDGTNTEIVVAADGRIIDLTQGGKKR